MREDGDMDNNKDKDIEKDEDTEIIEDEWGEPYGEDEIVSLE